MRKFFTNLRNFFRRGDMVLLLLCLVTSAFGCLMIASTTNHTGTLGYVYKQAGAIAVGVLVYMFISCLNVDFFSEHRFMLVLLNVLLLSLLIPFGTDYGSGNKSWLNFSFLPFAVQPAEYCKITFVLILASTMAAHQNRINSIRSIGHILWQLLAVAAVNYIISGDMGVSLIFVFICIIMAFAGGVNWKWIGGAVAGGVGVLIAMWNFVFTARQKIRILVLFDPSIDPQGLDARYHILNSQQSLNAGGLLGQGLFNGNRTQKGDELFAQHTDFIFSAIGEELGFVGCLLVVALLIAIIARCIHVGNKSPDYMRKMLCFGVAGALIFQTVVNVGMCIGILPIVGLTLPFISYGGSSIVSLFAMLGFVSGVHARPARESHERYVHAPLPRVM